MEFILMRFHLKNNERKRILSALKKREGLD